MLYNERFAGFSSHPRLEGTHAFLSPSSPAWIRYTPEKLIERLATARAAALGTELHETAARCIRRGIQLLPDADYPILAEYVNHAVEYGMVPEQMLFYSLNCYGTADAISFDAEAMFLRVHDLKTGTSNTTMEQLYVYAAIFCLEYGFKPFEIEGELRIYQEGKNEIFGEIIKRDDLSYVYSAIRNNDSIIEEYRAGGLI